MAKRLKKPVATTTEEERATCPECGSFRLGGLMAAFYVALKPDGSPEGNWEDWSSETEVGPERICYDCNHEW